MTIKQIVNTHPCPIIRGKIMENVTVTNYKKSSALSELTNLILYGINDWNDTKEGGGFWDAVYMGNNAPYSDLKHLDLSYVPEPAKPLPMWRKIDPNNLPIERVAAFEILNPNLLFTGTLYSDDDFGISLEMYKGATVHGFTHYIPLSDLINLPIED
jgi:hypothetical protein